jgi:hypothetical protein
MIYADKSVHAKYLSKDGELTKEALHKGYIQYLAESNLTVTLQGSWHWNEITGEQDVIYTVAIVSPKKAAKLKTFSLADARKQFHQFIKEAKEQSC